MALDESVLFDRLRRISQRHFDNPFRDAAWLAAMQVTAPSEDDLDDTLVYLSRYTRTPIPYFESLPIDRVMAFAKAAARLIAAENGKKPALDIASSGEENR